MISPVSTIPQVKQYLITTLQARSELVAPVLVQYGVPGPYEPNDIIAVTDTQQTFDNWAMVGGGGTHWLGETYNLEVVVDCFLGGDDPKTVEERALLLASVVVDVVRVDPSLGGLVTECRPLSMTTQGGWELEHKGRRAQVFIALHVMTEL